MTSEFKFIKTVFDIPDFNIYKESVLYIQALFDIYGSNDYSLFQKLLVIHLNRRLLILQDAYYDKHIAELIIGDRSYYNDEWNFYMNKLKEQSPPTLFVKEI